MYCHCETGPFYINENIGFAKLTQYSIIHKRLMYNLGRGFKRRPVNTALTEKYREFYLEGRNKSKANV